MHPSKTDLKTDAIIADATLTKKNSDLNAKLAEMEVACAEVEKERDFNFEKLRHVEVMLQVHQEKGDDNDPERLVANIFQVLYATVEDNYTVDDEGEFVKGGAPDGILKAVKSLRNYLPFAWEARKKERESVLEAVKNHGSALQNASEDLKDNKEIGLEAVKSYGYALAYASEALQNDRDIVLEAVKKTVVLFSMHQRISRMTEKLSSRQ
jgi:hypothetical protein